MSEPTLFDGDDDEPTLTETRAHARRSDPETSHAAAESVVDLRASQAAVLRVLGQGPACYDALIERYERARGQDPELPRQSVSGIRTRVAELRDHGYVKDTGERVVLPSGRAAIVWTVRR